MAMWKRFRIQLWTTVLLQIALGAAAMADCPDAAAVSPCSCHHGNEGLRLECSGEVGLPRLTTILRNEMCGKTIRQFELRVSDVEYLPSNLFFKTIVQDIQVSYTNISHFTRAGRSAFYGLESHLKSLSMRRCHLVDKIQWQMVGDLRALTYLDLSYNDLTAVPKQWFRHPPPNLISLILKGNKISTLERGALKYMHTLVELDLSDNRISSIRRDFFPQSGNQLIFLRFSNNRLRSLPDDLFDEMWGLRRIYLDNNVLETLKERVWSPVWGDLQLLDVQDNPLECDKDMAWVTVLRPPKLLYGSCLNSSVDLLGRRLDI